MFVLLQHMEIALLGSLMGGVLIGERLPTLVQKLSLGAQAIDILSRQVGAVGQAFQRFFEPAQQLIASVLYFGSSCQALLACLLLCFMVLQRFAATQYGLLEALLLFGSGRVIQLTPFPLEVAKATAIEWFPGRVSVLFHLRQEVFALSQLIGQPFGIVATLGELFLGQPHHLPVAPGFFQQALEVVFVGDALGCLLANHRHAVMAGVLHQYLLIGNPLQGGQAQAQVVA